MATVSIPLIPDNIVEMDEEFVIEINQPTVRGLTLGTLSMTTGIISDSTSECPVVCIVVSVLGAYTRDLTTVYVVYLAVVLIWWFGDFSSVHLI